MIGAGRDLATKKHASQAIFEALVTHTQMIFSETPLGLTLEVRELDPQLSFKHNNLHQYVAARSAAPESS
jgi:5-carboxymethyl-2-hydroxymuconate isomerase